MVRKASVYAGIHGPPVNPAVQFVFYSNVQVLPTKSARIVTQMTADALFNIRKTCTKRVLFPTPLFFAYLLTADAFNLMGQLSLGGR